MPQIVMRHAGLVPTETNTPATEAWPDPVIARSPVGAVVRSASGPMGVATATYDTTETFRFRLSRVWDPAGTRCLFVMLNPSTASELVLDPTVSRCVNFARGWGYGAVEVVNVFAYRATKPVDLLRAPDPIGTNNDAAIVSAATAADTVIAAWGVHATHRDRDKQVAQILDDSDIDTQCLRATKAGHPSHPLYIPGSTVPRAWRHPSAGIRR